MSSVAQHPATKGTEGSLTSSTAAGRETRPFQLLQALQRALLDPRGVQHLEVKTWQRYTMCAPRCLAWGRGSCCCFSTASFCSPLPSTCQCCSSVWDPRCRAASAIHSSCEQLFGAQSCDLQVDAPHPCLTSSRLWMWEKLPTTASKGASCWIWDTDH